LNFLVNEHDVTYCLMTLAARSKRW